MFADGLQQHLSVKSHWPEAKFFEYKRHVIFCGNYFMFCFEHVILYSFTFTTWDTYIFRSIYLSYRNNFFLWPPSIIYHNVYNLFFSLIIYSNAQVFQTHSMSADFNIMPIKKPLFFPIPRTYFQHNARHGCKSASECWWYWKKDCNLYLSENFIFHIQLW